MSSRQFDYKRFGFIGLVEIAFHAAHQHQLHRKTSSSSTLYNEVMKTVLLVPGFQHDLKNRDYDTTIKAIEAKGYKVEFVPIQWKRTTIDDWGKQLNEVYEQLKPEDTILAGFSYGAMTVLKAAADRMPSELWLFSLSPYFSEDIPLLKLAWLRTIGKQRKERFWRVSFNRLAPAITCKTLLFIGDNESSKYPDLKRRVEQAHTLLKGSKLIRIPGGKHDSTNPEYIDAIEHGI